MVNSSRALAYRAGGIADLAGIGRAKVEALAGVDFHGVEEAPADELGAGDHRRGARTYSCSRCKPSTGASYSGLSR